MNCLQRTLVMLLAVLMTIGMAAPAYAYELENEDELIAAALEQQEEFEESESASEEPIDTAADDEEAAEDEAAAAEDDAAADEEDAADDELSLDGGAQDFVWQTPGSEDVNILAGGTMLSDGDAFYYSSGGIYCDVGDETRCLSTDSGANLNLYDGALYYTTATAVRRVLLSDGTVETVYDCAGIDQLYVIGGWLMYLADGEVYLYDRTGGTLVSLDAPEGTNGLIPTQYGNLYLTGDVFDRTVWVDGSAAFEGVEGCYTDSGYLVVNRDGTYQIALETLFAGGRTLSDYDLHAELVQTTQLSEQEALEAEAEYLASEEYAALQEQADADSGVMTLSLDGASIYITAQQRAVLNGDTSTYNITRRARQQAEVLWTPLANRYGWGGSSTSYTVTSKGDVTTSYFKAGETYQGIPYSQAVANGSSHPSAGYVGWDLSVSDFVAAVNNSSSKFYSGYSTYNKTAPYYGSDCSGFVSWAWDLPYRCTCASLVNYSSYIGTSLNQIQLGDCLNKTSAHVVLVTDIAYDSSGNIIAIEITEQTPLGMRVTNYGERIPGKSNDQIVYRTNLNLVQTNYLNNGYVIYRRSYSKSVTYTASNAVALEEDGWLSAPTLSTAVSDDGSAILVTLSHKSGGTIHYTTDGTAATLSSPVYDGPFAVTSDTVIHAIADHSGTSSTGCFELIYTVEVDKAATPQLECLSGALAGTSVQAGSVLTMTSDSGTTIYYTTDGSEPTLLSQKLDAQGITISEATTLRAFAVSSSLLRSEELCVDLTLGEFWTITVGYTTSGTVNPEQDTYYALKDGDITLTFTAPDQYTIGDVLVNGTSVGAVSSYTLSGVDKDHQVQVKFVVSLPFADIKTTSWYADPVAYVYKNSLFVGTSSTSFSPNDSMTRGQFVAVLGRFAGVKSTYESMTTGKIAYTNGTYIVVRQSASTSSTALTTIASSGTRVTVTGSTTDSSGAAWYKVSYGSVTGYIKAYYNGKSLLNLVGGSFTDISGTYYNGYVQWGYYNDLIQGVSSTTFGGTAAISRQDICVILYRYLTSYCGKTLSTGTKTFTDESKIYSYASTAVHALANAGIVQGYTDGSFRPGNYASRAEVATMFMNLASYLGK